MVIMMIKLTLDDKDYYMDMVGISLTFLMILNIEKKKVK